VKLLGSSYVVLAEIPVRWLQSASQIPKPQAGAEAAMYPVWLMDGTGTRAHIFVRCPTCDAPLGLSPSSMGEQRGWNETPADVQLIVGCPRCSGTYMIEEEKAYCLSMIATPVPRTTNPRLEVAKPQ